VAAILVHGAARVRADTPGPPLVHAAVILSESVADSVSAAQPAKRWGDRFPLMKDEALARGYDLPYPYGVGAVYTYIDRLIQVTDVRIGVDGSPPRSVSQYVELGSRSWVNNLNAKLDVFVLPFLDVYAILGTVKNQSTTKAHVVVPKPPAIGGSWEFDTEIPTKLDGFVSGAGVTLAAGYAAYFLTVDGTYAQTDIGFDDAFKAGIVAVRTGWNGKVRARNAQVWLGGTYWNTTTTAQGTEDVPGVGHVVFEADQGPLHDTNWNLGTNVWFGKSWQAVADYGFNFDDVRILTLAGVFRF
jgi:hypothetical protein